MISSVCIMTHYTILGDSGDWWVSGGLLATVSFSVYAYFLRASDILPLQHELHVLCVYSTLSMCICASRLICVSVCGFRLPHVMVPTGSD